MIEMGILMRGCDVETNIKGNYLENCGDSLRLVLIGAKTIHLFWASMESLVNAKNLRWLMGDNLFFSPQLSNESFGLISKYLTVSDLKTVTSLLR